MVVSSESDEKFPYFSLTISYIEIELGLFYEQIIV